LNSGSRHLRGRFAAGGSFGHTWSSCTRACGSRHIAEGRSLRRSGSLTLSLRADGSDRDEERTSIGFRGLYAQLKERFPGNHEVVVSDPARAPHAFLRPVVDPLLRGKVQRGRAKILPLPLGAQERRHDNCRPEFDGSRRRCPQDTSNTIFVRGGGRTEHKLSPSFLSAADTSGISSVKQITTDAVPPRKGNREGFRRA
jgi:hypothetical protein